MDTAKVKLSNHKGIRRHIVKSKRSKKPLTLILIEERAAERFREEARKRDHKTLG
jgi:hypothetical protein